MALSGLLPLLIGRPEFGRLREQLARGVEPVALADVAESARPYVVAALAADRESPVLYLARDNKHVAQLHEAITTIAGDAVQVLSYSDSAAQPYERLIPEVEGVRDRLRALLTLSDSPRALVIVAAVSTLTRPVIPPADLADTMLELKAGQRVQPRDLMTFLLGAGYEMAVEVSEPGEMGHRGGIVDVFAPFLDRPVRIEFFDDEIDSLRTFDPVTQRSLNAIPSVLLGPAREALATRGPEAAKALGALSLVGVNAEARERIREDIMLLTHRQSFPDIAFYMPYLHEPASLVSYLPATGAIIEHSQGMIEQTFATLDEQGAQLRDQLEREGDRPPGQPDALLSDDQMARALDGRQRLSFSGLFGNPDETGPKLLPDLRHATSYGGRLRAFAGDVRGLMRHRQRVVIVTGQARRVAEMLDDEALLGPNGTIMISPETDLPDPPAPGALKVLHGTFPEGWQSEALALTVFTDAEVFGWSKRHAEQRKSTRGLEAFLAEVRPDDFVVHEDHGIGRFEGLTKLASEGVEREYLLVRYAGTDKLYIPTDQLDRLTRYIGMGDSAPALSHLGGTEWVRAKQRAKENATDVARDLLRLYSVRETITAHAFPSDAEQPWLQQLEDQFPWEETPDQARAIAEVKEDLERARPMDRLVCGDVGFGKTEVALRAAFKAVLDHHQVAVLVPTTVLALQHFNTFTERLREYPVRVELLSRFRSEKEQKEVVAAIAEGKVDVVVGTHRLLAKDVNFNKLGLLVIDEEQRFGVAHKERLKQMRTEVHVLTLTATPIPRTLYMALSNVRDMSVIETPPQERLPIRTHIREYDDALVREAILREIDRGGQVFFVHNRVRGIQALAEKLRKLVPEARVGVGHGQMADDELERIMLDFSSGQINVLVSTTIVENGLDIPNANTIIVNNSAFFGLGQLYQLRGRVGRSTAQAFAYFLYNKDQKLTPIAERRLRAIYEATELGSGFRIALADLELRGAGNLLGTEQSGFASAVGFDLYTRMLAETIGEMQGEVAPRPVVAPVQIELPVSALIGDDYINDRTLKLSFYQRLAHLTDQADLEAVEAEMTDRFGPPPDNVRALLALVQLKLVAGVLGFESVTERDAEVIFKLRGVAAVDRVGLFKRYRSDAVVSLGQVKVPRRRFATEPLGYLSGLTDLLPTIVLPGQPHPPTRM